MLLTRESNAVFVVVLKVMLNFDMLGFLENALLQLTGFWDYATFIHIYKYTYKHTHKHRNALKIIAAKVCNFARLLIAMQFYDVFSQYST